MTEKKDPTWELRDENQALWGKVWWDGKQIRSDKPAIIRMLKQVHYAGKSFEDGLDFLHHIRGHFGSGYVTMNKVA